MSASRESERLNSIGSARSAGVPNHTVSGAPGGQKLSFSTGEKLFIIGEVAFIFGNTRSHAKYTITDLSSNVATPIQLNQFRIYRSPSRPVGFVAWAYLTDEVAEAYAADRYELQPADWKAGSKPWFVEFVAPFGHARRIAADLRRNIFPTQHVRSLRRYPDGSTRIVDWYGAKYDVGSVRNFGK
jgi:cytolysin-activating lysine-acyltransferase